MEIKITLVKSLNGRLKDQIATAHSLGLRKIGDTHTEKDNPAVQGKIRKIAHLVSVENV
ncbi:MAG: 50S ribosomal protein L30 [Oscillospiraceae bacterium]|nr:50S ribosomal protein L30 [Oscillospiraceae bacterium]